MQTSTSLKKRSTISVVYVLIASVFTLFLLAGCATNRNSTSSNESTSNEKTQIRKTTVPGDKGNVIGSSA